MSAGQLAAADACADRLGTARAGVFLAAYAWLLRDHAPVGDVRIEVVTRVAGAGNAVGPFSPTSTCSRRTRYRVRCARWCRRSGQPAAPPPDALATVHTIFEDGDDGLPGQPVLCGRRSARSDAALVALANGVCWEHGPAFTESAVDELADDLERFLSVALAQPPALLPVAEAPAPV